MSNNNKSYQALHNELEEIVTALQQSGGEDIEATVKLYERGQKVVAELEKQLKAAENTIKKLSAKSK